MAWLILDPLPIESELEANLRARSKRYQRSLFHMLNTPVLAVVLVATSIHPTDGFLKHADAVLFESVNDSLIGNSAIAVRCMRVNCLRFLLLGSASTSTEVECEIRGQCANFRALTDAILKMKSSIAMQFRDGVTDCILTFLL